MSPQHLSTNTSFKRTPGFNYPLSPKQVVQYKTGDTEFWGIKNYEYDAPFVSGYNHIPANPIRQSPKRRDFMTLLLKDNSTKLSPNHYKVPDKEGFQMEAKGIKFPLCKAPRKTITEEIATRRSKVPHNTNYSPEKSSPRILGASKV